MTEVEIVGTAMTRFGKFPDSTIRSLAQEAVADALADAGLAAADVGMVFFSNAVAGILTGQEMIRGQAALRHTGLLGKPIVNVENACASASTAFHLAVSAVASGSVDVALAVGSEKLTHEDKAKSFAAIGTAVDLFQVDDLKAWAAAGSAGSPLPEEADAGGTGRSSWTSTRPTRGPTWSARARRSRTSPRSPSRATTTPRSTRRPSTARR